MSNLLNGLMNLPRATGMNNPLSLLNAAGQALPAVALTAGVLASGGNPLVSVLTQQLFSGALNTMFNNTAPHLGNHGQMAQALGNTAIAGLNLHHASPFLSAATPGGASMGSTLIQQNLLGTMANILTGMGVNAHNSPFMPQTHHNLVNAFAGGMNLGMSAPAQMHLSQPAITLPLVDANAFNQFGHTFGNQLNSQMTLQALNAVMPETSHAGKVTGGNEDTRATIGKFMDQHPAVFGQPQVAGNHSWEHVLKESLPLNQHALTQVLAAKNDLKTALTGGNIAANHLNLPAAGPMMNADAMLFNQKISQHATHHILPHISLL